MTPRERRGVETKRDFDGSDKKNNNAEENIGKKLLLTVVFFRFFYLDYLCRDLFLNSTVFALRLVRKIDTSLVWICGKIFEFSATFSEQKFNIFNSI